MSVRSRVRSIVEVPRVSSRANRRELSVDRRIRSWRTAVAWALATLGVAGLCGCGGGGGSGQVVRATWTFGLGDLAAETDYFNSWGAGTITVDSDSNAPEAAIAFLDCGSRFIVKNSVLLNVYPPDLQVFVLAHEFGHHYRGDRWRLLGVTDLAEEWIADAYAMRVVFAAFGDAFAQDCIVQMAAMGSPGDSTHPGSFQRAGYMQSILNAVLVNERSVPAPPGVSDLLPSTGTLIASDTLGLVTDVFVDSTFEGGPIPCGSIALDLKPGNHRVDLIDDITGHLWWTGIVTVDHGQTAFAPF